MSAEYCVVDVDVIDRPTKDGEIPSLVRAPRVYIDGDFLLPLCYSVRILTKPKADRGGRAIGKR